MIWLYTTSVSNRLIYIADVLLGKGQYQLTTDSHVLNQESPCINYSDTPGSAAALQIIPSGILFETGLHQHTIEVGQWQNMPVFFCTQGTIPFDLFGAAFYLLSRYEEYLPHTKDTYGRYSHANSLAYKHQFLHIPLIEYWQQGLHKALAQTNSGYIFKAPAFEICISYDIDIAYKYNGKGVWRNLAGFVKDALNFNWVLIPERIGTLAGNIKDPFDQYEAILSLHKQTQIPAVFFLLVAARQEGYDKNIDPAYPVFQQLAGNIAALHTTGLHPSTAAFARHQLLQDEKKQLEGIIKKPITCSRQHYIMMNLPATYQALITAGIQADYSMGYGSINGFRASYSRPYHWFDLSTNTISDLVIHPFCWMDANSIFEEKQTPDEAKNQLIHYTDALRQTGGILGLIFHNHFLTTDKHYSEWHKLWAWTIKYFS